MAAIIQWNIQGYSAKYEDLKRLIYCENPGVIALQETMLGANIPRSPSGYKIYSNYEGRPVPGNGLAMIIRNDMPHQHLQLQTNLQAMAFRIRLNHTYTVCNIYLPHNQNITIEELTRLYDQLPQPVLICGDFNCRHMLWDVAADGADRRGNTIESLILNTSLTLLNNRQPTHFHIQTNTLSAIDLSLCSPAAALDITWEVMDDLYGSDHFPISIKETNAQNPALDQRFQLHKADWKLFETVTMIEPFDEILTIRSIDDLISFFNNHIIAAAEIAIPKSSPFQQPRKVPWWNAECTQANYLRKRALRRYQRTQLLVDRISYQRERANAKRVKHLARITSWRKYIDTLNINTPMAKIWKRIKKIRGNYEPIRMPCLTRQGELITEPAQVAEMMAEHYESISSNQRYSEQFKRVKGRMESTVLNFNTNAELEYNAEFTMLEMERALASCKNTAPGEDMISYKMVKHSHITCRKFLLAIINRIWKMKEYPSQWRSSIVLSFLKPQKTPTEESSYRPVSLTSCVGKIMEKIVNIRLVMVLESRKLIPPFQFGFRRMQGTMDSLTKVTSDILKTLNQKQSVLCVSFDMEKAYDTTWRYGILKTLHRFGLRGELPIFIQQFLTNRTFKTKIGSSISTEHRLQQGVPQGSVLSCSLFSVALNEILSKVPHGVQSCLYVDDLLIYTSGNYFPGLERRIQNAINAISNWTNSHGFKFSPTKTVAIHFHRKRAHQTPPNLYINGNLIRHDTSIKYLGMTLDHKLNWREHIKKLKIDCVRRLDLLKCVSHHTWGADRTIMLRLYRSIIRSKLDYGSFIYCTASKSALELLNPIHNAAIRLCTGAFRSSPVISLYADSGEAPLHVRRNQLMLQYYARSQQLPTSPVFEYVRVDDDVEEIEDYVNQPMNLRIGKAIREVNVNFNVMPYKYPNQAVWLLDPEITCNTFNYPTKKHTTPDNLKHSFLQHKDQTHRNQFPIYTDGSKNDNDVGCAAVSIGRAVTRRLDRYASIFTAELNGVLCALDIIEETNRDHYVIFCDSQSVIKVMKQYNSTHPIIANIISKLLILKSRDITIQFCWCPAHVGVTGNERADREAIHAANDNTLPILAEHSYRDFYPIIKGETKQCWNTQWHQTQGNKLRNIKPHVFPWISSNLTNRRKSIILTRLRIGHTLISHQYLMERREPPYCEDCIVPLTVKHIIAECPNHQQNRRLIYPMINNTMSSDDVMREMLAEKPDCRFDHELIMRYVTDIGIVGDI